ncbi:isoprenyl transferase [Stappia sp.]|uniref:isoprenyl transferase n=1 Tax=Stappia sp. TaxID=1870903 RepID=UPI0032D93011
MTVTAGLDVSAQLDADRRTEVPRHVAVIMDGNGRWAAKRGLPRTEGHRAGVSALRRIVRHCADRGVACLTLFSFSSENWKRPAAEVGFLMGLLERFVRRDLAEIHRQNVRVRMIGEREGLDRKILDLIEEGEALTRDNTGMTLVVAFNYGARNELARAMRRMSEDIAAGRLSACDVTERRIESYLDTACLPDPDLIIRTSGEQRLSNFLLWQAAYAEFYFPDTHWPDFDEEALDDAFAAYAARDRRFGGLSAKVAR